MKKNNFAIIVSTENGSPIVIHISVMITEKSNDLYISGHFAKATSR
ncbi:hypothetical protein BUZ00_14275 [Staphylococcus gallinarum]|nr:hypothetical protein [Staphylococcus gallinarum]MCD8793030.1 hypothetical protein [Staphylococcus gallinarum]PTE27166.1 hypothetical protein BUZ00_14275 [Staphylococcus gallinarum]RIL26440.1 hypothetical protein BUY95_13855 [Staphylococcus gallinarum]RIO81544.1 hypothetical protein BUZ10_13710 [Staphylococcus gallinarum]